jgi:hypothetical protein
MLTSENWRKMNFFLESNVNLSKLIKQRTGFVCQMGKYLIGMTYSVLSENPTDLCQENGSYIRFLGVNTKSRGS